MAKGGQVMIHEVSKLLVGFRDCFSRTAAFEWFVIVIMGFLSRVDHHGVTSMIRWLALRSGLYTALLSFFRADSWCLKDIQKRWQHIVLSAAPWVQIRDRYILIGDGIKISKEAQKMPGVKRLHQESDNSGKPEYIYGHHHGVLGILAGQVKKLFCIPLCAELHEGVQELRQYQGKPLPVVDGKAKTSVTTLMASMAVDLVKGLCAPCLLILDAYFAVGPVFLILKQVVDAQGQRLLHIVTRAKSNVVGYEDPPPKTGHRGAPRKYGDKISLTSLFGQKSLFQEAILDIYRERKTLLFYCVDLLWKPIQEKVRFVLVIDGTEIFILMSSDLTLSPEDMIRAYGYRFKIEVNFKVMKHLMGVFFYHFWTKVWPRIRKNKEGNLPSLEDREKYLIALAANAIESFVNFGCIATGILQILALNHEHRIWQNYKGWLRTISSAVPSEEIVKSVIQEEFFHNFHSFSNTAIYRIIMSKSKKAQYNELPKAA